MHRSQAATGKAAEAVLQMGAVPGAGLTARSRLLAAMPRLFPTDPSGRALAAAVLWDVPEDTAAVLAGLQRHKW